MTWASVMAPILTRDSPILPPAAFFFMGGMEIFLFLRGKIKLFGYSGFMYWSKSTSGRARLWQELAGRQPAEVCRRSLAAAETGGYSLGFLDRRYRVEPEAGRIGGPQEDPLLADAEFELLVLTYLTQAADTPAERNWISEKDLPGGSHVLSRAARPAARAPPGQVRAGPAGLSARGGGDWAAAALPYGDAAYGFTALPRIPAGCLLWVGDEEFPARAGMLFDRTLGRHLPLDVVLALAHCLVLRLLEAAGPATR